MRKPSAARSRLDFEVEAELISVL